MTESEQAVLKTIIYSDIFEYALKKEEIFNYLIGKRLSLNNIDKILNFLIRKKIVVEEKGYYYLKQEKSLAQLRQKRADISRKKIIKAQKWARFLKLNPYLKMVAITGTLAVENADVGDDIDLMLVFSKNRLFLGRIIDGLAAGNISTAQSYLVDISKDEKERTENLGLLGAVFGIGVGTDKRSFC